MQPPSHVAIHLGVEIDTHEWQLRIPQEKCSMLLNLLHAFCGRRSYRLHELHSLLGKLYYASLGRAFVNRLLNVLRVFAKKPLHYWIHLNSAVRSDIRWWRKLLTHWNG